MLHHVALGAHDVERLAVFYGDVCGLRELQRHHTPEGALRSVWMQIAPAAVLMIEHTEHTRPIVEGLASGPFLLAFAAPDPSIDAIRARLGGRGVDVESTTQYTAYFRDPEGNRVALSLYPLAIP